MVKLNGEMVYLWRAVDHEGEVLESREPSLRIFPHFAMPVGGLGELRKGPR
jgi:hypothetical protein